MEFCGLHATIGYAGVLDDGKEKTGSVKSIISRGWIPD